MVKTLPLFGEKSPIVVTVETDAKRARRPGSPS